MNSTFGARLRKELLDFLSNMESRPRSYSTSSNASSQMLNFPSIEAEDFAVYSVRCFLLLELLF